MRSGVMMMRMTMIGMVVLVIEAAHSAHHCVHYYSNTNNGDYTHTFCFSANGRYMHECSVHFAVLQFNSDQLFYGIHQMAIGNQYL